MNYSDDSSEIKMNWTFALVASVVIHVVGLGLVLLCSDDPGEVEEPAVQEEAPAQASGGSEDGNSEPAGDSGQAPAPATAPTAGTAAPTPAPVARTVLPRTPTRVPADPAPTAGSTSRVPVSDAPSTGAVASSASATKTIVYEVKPGDNLSKIAKKHKCTETEIIKLNKIKNPNRIWVGLKLKIPAPVE